jgi:hypothetical protein
MGSNWADAGQSALKGITNSIPGGSTVVAIGQALGVGKKHHSSLTFIDRYGQTQHTSDTSAKAKGYSSPEAERDAFLARQDKQIAAQGKTNKLALGAGIAIPVFLIVGFILLKRK